MSKSNLKPEDIFFGIQKTYERKPKEAKPEVAAPEATEEGKPVVEELEDEPKKQRKPRATKQVESDKKKRGPVPNPDNSSRVAVNVQMSPEIKYTMTSIINEMKLQGVKDRYNITDFVIEAIEEKIKRSKKQLNME